MTRVYFVNRVYPPARGATGQLLRDLAEGLAGRGFKLTVITGGAGELTQEEGVRVWRVGAAAETGTGLVAKAWAYRRFTRAALHVLRTELNPGDVVVPMTDPPLLVAGVRPLATRAGALLVPWVQDIHPEVVQALLPPILRWPLAWARRQRNRAWQTATRIVAPGTDMARVIERQGIPTDRIAVIPNWAPRDLRPPGSDEVARFRAARGWTDQKVMMYSGNLGRVHDAPPILHLALALRDRTDVIIAMIGGGPRTAELRRQAQRQGLPSLVFLPAYSLADLAPGLAAADVHLVTLQASCAGLVWPSKFYGITAVDRPILYLGPAEAEIAALIQRHGLGHVATHGEIPGARAWIETLLESPATAAGLRDRIRAFNRQDGGLDNRLSSWLDLIQNSLACSVSGAPQSGSRSS